MGHRTCPRDGRRRRSFLVAADHARQHAVRGAAEALAAARRAARIAAEAASRDAETALRRPPSLPPAVTDHLECWLLRCVHERRARRVLNKLLLPVVADRAFDLLAPPHGETVVRLCEHGWIRRADAWRPRGKGASARLRSLIMHLLASYPVPAFVVDGFIDPGYGPRYRLDPRVLVRLGRGASVRACVDEGLIPGPLTRRMRHLFLTTPSRVPVAVAAQRAQVLAAGGDERLARTISAAFEEAFLPDQSCTELVAYFCRHPGLTGKQMVAIVAYFESLDEAERRLRLADRRPAALLDEADRAIHGERWSRVLGPLPSCGLAPGAWETVHRNAGTLEWSHWTFEELRHVRELIREGAVMRHCAASYVDRVREGRSAIWSLRENGRRRATVEVDPRRRRIVQAARKGDLPVDRMAGSYILRWAEDHGLEVAAESMQ